MAKISVLPGTAGDVLTINQQFLYGFLTIGSSMFSNMLDSINVVVSGVTTINVKGADFCDAFMSLAGQLIYGSPQVISPGLRSTYTKRVIPIADGSKAGETCLYTFTQSIDAVADVYGSGLMSFKGGLWGADMTKVLTGSSNVFSDFDFLLVDKTNLDKVSVTFQTGWTEELGVEELDSILALVSPVDYTVSYSDGIAVLHGEDIKSVRLFAGGDNLDVCIVKVP